MLLFCTGNEDDADDDDAVDNDGIFQIPDDVFSSAGRQTSNLTINGDYVSQFIMFIIVAKVDFL